MSILSISLSVANWPPSWSDFRCCIDRPPNFLASSNNSLVWQIHNLHDDYSTLLLIGYFNAPLVNWFLMTVDTLATSFSALLLEACETRLMLLHVGKWTHFWENHHSLPNLVTTKDSHNVRCMSHRPNLTSFAMWIFSSPWCNRWKKWSLLD